MIKIEYSRNLEKAKIANVGMGIDGKKILRLYEHQNEDNYKVGHTTQGKETLDKLMKGRKCLAELTFYHNESIDSLIKVLEDLKNSNFINEKEDPDTYKECKEILEEKSNLVTFAENELNILIDKCEDEEAKGMQKLISNDILQIVEVFSQQGHSGFSANYAINLINKLLRYEPISPLTGADDEWNKLDYADNIKYQNKRCPRVFKDAEGKAYDIEGKIFSEDGECWYTSKESKVFIEFPYIPKTEEVIIKNKE